MEKLDVLYQQVSSAEMVLYGHYPDLRHLFFWKAPKKE